MLQHLTEELQTRREDALLGGGPDKIALQHNRGLLTAREKIEKWQSVAALWRLGAEYL
jgi:methylmalonyl-CoA decarboxylase subunit alpha